MASSIRRIVAADLPPAERLCQRLVGRVLFLFDRERHLRHTLDDVYQALLPASKRHRERSIRSEVALFRRVLREGAKRRQFASADAAEMAAALIMATNCLTPFRLSVRQRGQRQRVERQVRAPGRHPQKLARASASVA
jgi:hypothetical protein